MDFVVHHWREAFEILVLAIVIYFVLRFIRGTRGARVLIGLVVLLLLLTLISQIFRMEVIGWLLGHFLAFLGVALVIIFQPELRRALAELGTQPIFFSFFSGSNIRAVIDTLVKSALSFSSRGVGALIAVEREMGLRAHAEGGVMLGARLSHELLDQIFFPNSPLHDGGVIIQNDRLTAAACIFPLTQRTDLAASVGTRHRAALGLAEDTDALVLVVSEETGKISIASHGEFHQNVGPDKLHGLLMKLLVGDPQSSWLGRLQSLFSGRNAGREENEPPAPP